MEFHLKPRSNQNPASQNKIKGSFRTGGIDYIFTMYLLYNHYIYYIFTMFTVYYVHLQYLLYNYYMFTIYLLK